MITIIEWLQSDLEGVKKYWVPLMYPDFNVWKKVGNCVTCVMLHTTVVSYFFPDIEVRKYQRKPVILDTFKITDVLRMAPLKGEGPSISILKTPWYQDFHDCSV